MYLRIIRAGVLVFLSVVMGILSCSKDDSVVVPGNLTQTEIEANVQSETWRISLFIDSGVDETKDFAGYKFIFNANGVLDTGNGIIEHQGTWSITDSNSADDSQDDLDFNIHFDLTNDFEDLNDDWDFISYSATKIELFDISGGSGDVDILTFEKN